MKQAFLLLVVGGLVLAVLGAAVYLFLRSIYSVFDDYRARRELKAFGREYAADKQARLEKESARLNTGCEHQWGGMLSGFPPNACRKCGMEKTLPFGNCDHVWKFQMSATPSSVCEKCKKVFSNAEME